MNKPKVDYIKGIAPAIAIEQKVNSSNPRSTVGTTTEIYDYLKLLYARIGKTYSPISGKLVKKHTVSDVVDYVKTFSPKTKLLLLAPVIVEPGRGLNEKLKILLQQGYVRVKQEGKVEKLTTDTQLDESKEAFIVIDRIITKANDDDFYNRLADACNAAFYEGKGSCIIEDISTTNQQYFSNKFELDNITFVEPTTHLFSFNNPYGACPKCEGYGSIIGIDKDLVIPDTSKSVYENAIAPWRGEKMQSYKNQLINNAYKFDFPIHRPYFELTDKQKEILWHGNGFFDGIYTFFDFLESKPHKIQNRVMLSRYRGKTTCRSCKGRRLRKEAEYVKIQNTSISELVDLPISELILFFDNLELNTYETSVAQRLLKEIRSRLHFLNLVGLNYLSLNRKSNTLSGGESQRINLATSLGSSLVGSMYILDEPSIGLHSRDNEKLIEVLKSLRDLGNTVIVVEHDEELMKIADQIIDIGPEAGRNGGQLVAQGTYKNILKSDSLTSQYLSGKLEIAIPKRRRNWHYSLKIVGARENNLKNINVTIPLGIITAITGVSGSGKSTLVREIVFPVLNKHFDIHTHKPGQFTSLEGDFSNLTGVEFIDQNPIGRSSRSNPVTYVKAYDDIRHLFANQRLSKLRNFQAKHFSFNVDGGRCDVCKGEGEVTIEMQFMADVKLECEHCKGKRFKKEILEVQFHNKSIDDILRMTIDEAILFFSDRDQMRIVKKLQPLQDVGLGYVQLGQSSSTLSGGEAQRIKLASFLIKGKTKNKQLFIFDEPTTGLHFHDIQKLVVSLNALIDNGHSVIVIEHNMDLIKCADHIIDIGPEGGDKGGYIVAEGTPEQIVQVQNSYTGQYLRAKL